MSIAVENAIRSVNSDSFTVMELEKENRIYAPKLPFVSVMPADGVSPEKTILIKGLISGKRSNFEVNLCCGLQVEGLHRDNIALHISSRFTSDYKVVVNSLIDDQWGVEERYKNPLRKGQPFVILIAALPSVFKVAINHSLSFEYRHRIEPSEIKTMHIQGAAVVDAVEFISSASPPTSDENAPREAVANGHAEPFVQYIQQLPYVSPINYGRNYPTVKFTLAFTDSPYRTIIDFVAGNDIAFHSSIRFDEKALVRNTLRNGQWLSEERLFQQFLFQQSCSYEIEIYCDPTRFVMRIGGQHAYNYDHRMSPELIDHFKIHGSGRLLKICIA